MPLVRYEIRNEQSLGKPELYGAAAAKGEPDIVLESVTVAALVGIVRQLGDLAEFAAEIFDTLHVEVTATASRSQSLTDRLRQLEAEVNLFETKPLHERKNVLFSNSSAYDQHASIQEKQNHLCQKSPPTFISKTYKICRGPPRLYVLDKFDAAGAGSCLKRYSDPSFFRSAWTYNREKVTEKTPKKNLDRLKGPLFQITDDSTDDIERNSSLYRSKHVEQQATNMMETGKMNIEEPNSSDDISSDIDYFVDALTSMDSEIEPELELHSRQDFHSYFLHKENESRKQPEIFVETHAMNQENSQFHSGFSNGLPNGKNCMPYLDGSKETIDILGDSSSESAIPHKSLFQQCCTKGSDEASSGHGDTLPLSTTTAVRISDVSENGDNVNNLSIAVPSSKSRSTLPSIPESPEIKHKTSPGLNRKKFQELLGHSAEEIYGVHVSSKIEENQAMSGSDREEDNNVEILQFENSEDYDQDLQLQDLRDSAQRNIDPLGPSNSFAFSTFEVSSGFPELSTSVSNSADEQFQFCTPELSVMYIDDLPLMYDNVKLALPVESNQHSESEVTADVIDEDCTCSMQSEDPIVIHYLTETQNSDEKQLTSVYGTKDVNEQKCGSRHDKSPLTPSVDSNSVPASNGFGASSYGHEKTLGSDSSCSQIGTIFAMKEKAFSLPTGQSCSHMKISPSQKERDDSEMQVTNSKQPCLDHLTDSSQISYFDSYLHGAFSRPQIIGKRLCCCYLHGASVNSHIQSGKKADGIHEELFQRENNLEGTLNDHANNQHSRSSVTEATSESKREKLNFDDECPTSLSTSGTNQNSRVDSSMDVRQSLPSLPPFESYNMATENCDQNITKTSQISSQSSPSSFMYTNGSTDMLLSGNGEQLISVPCCGDRAQVVMGNSTNSGDVLHDPENYDSIQYSVEVCSSSESVVEQDFDHCDSTCRSYKLDEDLEKSLGLDNLKVNNEVTHGLLKFSSATEPCHSSSANSPSGNVEAKGEEDTSSGNIKPSTSCLSNSQGSNHNDKDSSPTPHYETKFEVSNPLCKDTGIERSSLNTPPPPPLPPLNWWVKKTPKVAESQSSSLPAVSKLGGSNKGPHSVGVGVNWNDLLIKEIASHDRSKLNKVARKASSFKEQSSHNKEELIQQIKTQSFRLRPIAVKREEIVKEDVVKPKPEIKNNVSTMLEKVNAIRQAMVGSEEEEDDWSDS